MLSTGGRGMLSNTVHLYWIVQVPQEENSVVVAVIVLIVVVFEISPSHVKTFHYRPQRSQPPPPGPIARCATSLRWLWVKDSGS